MKFALLLLLSVSQMALAITFTHKDWEITCDNTLTCRAAGYNSESAAFEENSLVSVLLTRNAGAKEAVSGHVRIDYMPAGKNDSKEFMVNLSINSKDYGDVAIELDSGIGNLNSTQTDALLQSLLGTAKIIFSYKPENVSWRLSDSGATAVLLKMDDVQGRVNTPSALVKKGNSTKPVKAAVAIPVINVPAIPEWSTEQKVFFQQHKAQIFSVIQATEKQNMSNNDDMFCNEMLDASGPGNDFEIHPLTETKSVVVSLCWLAAYNGGSGVWLINNKPPYEPKMVDQDASNYDKGVISVTQKGRGIGDCWSFYNRTWNGKEFVDSYIADTGMCRGFAGGAWTMPSYVTQEKLQ